MPSVALEGMPWKRTRRLNSVGCRARRGAWLPDFTRTPGLLRRVSAGAGLLCERLLWKAEAAELRRFDSAELRMMAVADAALPASQEKLQPP